MACWGTLASDFIEQGHYQLHTPETDEAVNQKNFLQCITEHKELDVTILLRGSERLPNVCPRCEHLFNDTSDGKQWLRWQVPPIMSEISQMPYQAAKA